jgi:hypothetical protein
MLPPVADFQIKAAKKCNREDDEVRKKEGN